MTVVAAPSPLDGCPAGAGMTLVGAVPGAALGGCPAGGPAWQDGVEEGIGGCPAGAGMTLWADHPHRLPRRSGMTRIGLTDAVSGLPRRCGDDPLAHLDEGAPHAGMTP